jgi:hypothetical protein
MEEGLEPSEADAADVGSEDVEGGAAPSAAGVASGYAPIL